MTNCCLGQSLLQHVEVLGVLRVFTQLHFLHLILLHLTLLFFQFHFLIRVLIQHTRVNSISHHRMTNRRLGQSLLQHVEILRILRVFAQLHFLHLTFRSLTLLLFQFHFLIRVLIQYRSINSISHHRMTHTRKRNTLLQHVEILGILRMITQLHLLHLLLLLFLLYLLLQFHFLIRISIQHRSIHFVSHHRMTHTRKRHALLQHVEVLRVLRMITQLHFLHLLFHFSFNHVIWMIDQLHITLSSKHSHLHPLHLSSYSDAHPEEAHPSSTC